MCIRDRVKAENSTFQSIAYDYSDVDLNMESIRLYRYLQHNVVLYPDLQYLFVHKTRTEPLIVLAPNPTYYAFSLSNFEMRNYLIKMCIRDRSRSCRRHS